MKIRLLLLTLFVFFFTATAQAATFTVNSINDGSDANTADNICETATTGECTLRAAIEQANANAENDTINFNIPGAGVKTITPAKALPDITQPVTIDGYTQPGSGVNTLATTDNAVILIELSGANAGANVNGLTLFANDSTLRGLAINRFSRVGISLSGGDNNIISGNFIGTDPTGLIDLGNGSVGIYGEFASQSNNNLIGGTTPAERNIVSGNGNAGILFEFQAINNVVQGNFIGLAADGSTVLSNNGFGIGFGSFTNGTIIGGDDAADGATDGIVGARNYISGNTGSGIFIGSGITILGNYIGTDATGTLARANAGSGIETNVASGTIIGGAAAGAGNLISGNTGDGISTGFTGSLVIKGNRIGTQANGVGNLGNGGDGVEIASGGSNNQIGGIAAGEGNIIAFNGEDGVQITDVGNSPINNPILSNSVFSNVGLGINLSVDGVSANDTGDADTGANNLQNFPVITTALSGNTQVIGTFNSTANTLFRLEFFNTPAADPSGNGEGQFFVGAVNVTTDANGNATFNQTFAFNSPLNSFVSATATNLTTNDTSEFSNAKQVDSPTAALVRVGGQVLNETARGIFGARVLMIEPDGNMRYAITNPFGYYHFADVPAGATYIIAIKHKHYAFAPQIITVNDERYDINFFASTSGRLFNRSL